MINFLYCLDENYNIQAFTSILSLLDNLSEKANFFIIHRNLDRFKKIPSIISKHEKLNKLTTYSFSNLYDNFPNVKNSHISEATYYRLFISQILPKELSEIIYIDCDIISTKPIRNEFKKIFDSLNQSNQAIGVKTEFLRDKNNEYIFSNLKLENDKYFNAGVMFINLEKWRAINIEEKAKNIIEDNKIELAFWDQDILNKLFDGEYFEIENKYNYGVDVENFKLNNNEIFDKSFLIHYMGSKKPWTVEGLLNSNSNFYQKYYQQLGMDNYHITHKWKKYSTYLFLLNLINFRLIKNHKFLKLVQSFLNSMKSKGDNL